MKKPLFVIVYFFTTVVFSQGDSIKISNQFFPYNKERTKLVGYSQVVVGYTANFASLYQFWYKDYPKSRFHFFNDFDEYLQVDKVSHMWGAYTAGNLSMQMWKWAGASKKNTCG